MLKRKIDQILLEWKNRKNKKALLIKGARQIGKTTSIRNFGKQNYQSFIEINFESNPTYRQIFDGSLDAKTILLNMSAYGLGPFIENKTLIFFDEIQSCPQARTAIKFLVEDGRFDYIESGSLLGINYKDVSSYPVGFEEHIEMHSIDFEEFLMAKNVGNEVIKLLKESLENRISINDFIHQTMMRNFREFIIVGGMPEVVQIFLNTSDINEVIRIQKSIIDTYRDDISKYAQTSKVKVKEIYDAIPEQLSKKNKRFYFTNLAKEPTLRSYDSAIMWLFDAGIVRMCCNVSSPELPLALNQKRNIFKLFMKDTGLLVGMSYQGIQKSIIEGDLSINEGGIMENAIADALMKTGKNLYYYTRNKPNSLEIDFVFQKSNEIFLVEVKSGKGYKSHKSLDKLMLELDNSKYQPIVLYTGNINFENNILYLPLYLASFL